MEDRIKVLEEFGFREEEGVWRSRRVIRIIGLERESDFVFSLGYIKSIRGDFREWLEKTIADVQRPQAEELQKEYEAGKSK